MAWAAMIPGQMYSIGSVATTISRQPQFFQTPGYRSDKEFVSRFVDNAVQILNAAENVVETGHTPSEMTILISAEGGIRMIADSDWPLDSLQAHHGAGMAYRVSHGASMVRVEGRAGSRTCLFETAKPDWAARHLLNRTPSYRGLEVAVAPSPRLLPAASLRS